MRILVAGATSVPGIPLLRELNARGHDVIGMTSQPAKTAQIEQQGAKPVVADVFDAAQIDAVVADIEPEVVVSLLTTLPKRGPMRVKDFEPARELWSRGAPNLVVAAQRAGVRRVVAESVIFAYGYPSTGPAIMDESDPYPGPPPPGGAEMLAALRGMEQTVLASGEHSDTEGIVLRYGVFYGPGVPHDELFVRLAKWWALPAMTGNGMVPWIHIDDVATAFRFFLNAEDQLRTEALKAIHRQLNDSGRLVCNIHMNSTSPVGVACRLINWLLGRTIRNTLSTARFEELLTSSGFIAETVIPYGYLPRPGRLLPGLCEALILPVEKASNALGFPGRLAQHFLVVARKR